MEEVRKTARDVIEHRISTADIDERDCSSLLADAVIAALDDAGFVTVPKGDIRKALDDATGLDKWHKFGEGYVGLREFLENLAQPPQPIETETERERR